jgi:diguanylate cyclase (GGDEF)-like protein
VLLRRDRLVRTLLRGLEPASPELLELARRSGLLLSLLATVLMPSWSVVDVVLEPSLAPAFAVVRLAGAVPMLVCVLLLWRHPLGRRRPELLTWLVLSLVQCEIAWMVPQVQNAEFYLLGFTLAVYGSGCVLVARPVWTAALVVTSWTALGLALAIAEGMPAHHLVAATMYLTTASMIGLVAHDQRARLARKQRAARVRLEQEQARTHQLLRRLERLSNEDALTGLANRRRWDEAMAAACAGADPVAVILVDVDRFKQVNDRYGHAGGDAALREVAALLIRHVRADDVVARLGGDEFAVLVTGADEVQAAQLAERLRAGAVALQPPGFAPGDVTLSLGVAAASTAPEPERLMSAADAQLYRAKTTRNAVGTAAAVPAS